MQQDKDKEQEEDKDKEEVKSNCHTSFKILEGLGQSRQAKLFDFG